MATSFGLAWQEWQTRTVGNEVLYVGHKPSSLCVPTHPVRAEGGGLEPPSPFGRRFSSPLTAFSWNHGNVQPTPILAGQKEVRDLHGLPGSSIGFRASDGLYTAHVSGGDYCITKSLHDSLLSISGRARLPELPKYSFGMATATLSTAPRRNRPLLLLVIAVVLFALLITYLLLRAEPNEPTAQVTYGSLASSHFTEQLPLGIVLDRRRAIPISGEGELLGRVSFSDFRKTTGGSGGIVVVSYQVYGTAEAAKSAYERQMQGLRESNDAQGSTYRFFQTDISRPHTCVDEGQEFCSAVVGNVTVEALSRIHILEDGPSRVGSILGPALDHLDSH